MKTIGALLREARERSNLSLEDIQERTKIRKQFLIAMEQDQYDRMPSEVSMKGFIQIYARELGLDQKSALAMFRRDFTKSETGAVLPHMLVQPLTTRHSVIERLRSILIVAGIGIFLLLGFFAYQWIGLNQVPNVAIYEPQENQQVHQDVTVRGKTVTDVVVTVNGKTVSLTQDGTFETLVSFDAGEHTVSVEIKTRQGKSRLVQRTVHVIE